MNNKLENIFEGTEKVLTTIGKGLGKVLEFATDNILIILIVSLVYFTPEGCSVDVSITPPTEQVETKTIGVLTPQEKQL